MHHDLDLWTPKSTGYILDSLGVSVWSFMIIGGLQSQLWSRNRFQSPMHHDLDLWTPKSTGHILDSWGVSVWSVITISQKVVRKPIVDARPPHIRLRAEFCNSANIHINFVGCFEDFTFLQQYFSHIATWKQEIPYLWNRSGETRVRTTDPCSASQELLKLLHHSQPHTWTLSDGTWWEVQNVQNSQYEHRLVTDLSVIWKALNSGVCMQNMKLLLHI